MGTGGYYSYLQNLAACFGSTDATSCSPLPFSGPDSFPAMFGLPAMIVAQCDANDTNMVWKNGEFPVIEASGVQTNLRRSNICAEMRAMIAATGDAE